MSVSWDAFWRIRFYRALERICSTNDTLGETKKTDLYSSFVAPPSMGRREVVAAWAAAVVLVGLAAALRSGSGGAGELLAAAPSAQKEAARKRLGAKALAFADHSKTARELHDIEHDLKLSIKRLAPKAKQMALSAENGEEPAAEVGFASPPSPRRACQCVRSPCPL